MRPHQATLLPPLPPCAGGVGVGDEWPLQVRVYDYVLAYKFSLKEAADGVSVRFPSLNSQLYESPYEAQLWAVFDTNKQLLRFGDYYPEPVKLKAGDYEVRLQLRHESPAFLERLKDVIGAVNHTVLLLEGTDFVCQSPPLRCAYCLCELAYTGVLDVGFDLILAQDDEDSLHLMLLHIYEVFSATLAGGI